LNRSQRVLLFGASGKLGLAVHRALESRGHRVLTASRTSGEYQVDVRSSEQIAAVYERAGHIDAVATATGHVPYKLIRDMTPADYLAGFQDKILAQIEIVRLGLTHVDARGSFTLITGVFGRQPVLTATAAAMANGAIEGFVRAAALEIAPQRINAVSPTIFTESVADAGDAAPGFQPVPLSVVGDTYIRSIEGAQTGQVWELGN
jgi:NAD(P)-dependent dehydrogenase (short-subunit alcohol dehydrogenase family)